ncbi:hypothetical protein [Fusobacterium ulcerans]|uniref:DUF4402 domain-containing protein n=1 Tax=Fusobacterium ulcerans 12-1B TaxID=457404 RepID=H1PRU0_9FUSO|nr:hypothetical protein [Fusobacterium ulcerans]EHO83103.1 hypothetical protein HMPREF0402_01133 [Fusobacterium ulcerans 12-1B]
MKKLLLLAGLLVVASSVFADEPAKKVNTEASKNVDIYAQVVTDLSIETEPLNFGVVGIGDTKIINPEEAGAGSFTIKGASNTNIILSINDIDKDNSSKFENGEIKAFLKRVTAGGVDGSGNGRLEPIIGIYDGATKLENNVISLTGSTSLHMAHTKKFGVVGSVTTSDSQNTGNYKGAIKVTAKYDSWSGPINKID